MIPLADGSVDLVTCFGTLHHIANVSAVVREMSRVLRTSGYALVREPIISMGDWSRPRRGLMTRERGIPRALPTRAVRDAGFEIERETLCMFPLTGCARKITRRPAYNSPLLVHADQWLARMAARNERYHSEGLRTLRPTNVLLVLRRQ